jgi:hypothetical protein
VVFFAFLSSICAQQTIPLRHVGDPEDWSTNQIVFSRDAVARHPGLIDREPRIRHRLVPHWQPPHGSAVQGITNLPILPKESGLQRDWSVTTLGARLRENAFPAKYTFNPDAPPSCANDYVVFGLSTIGAPAGQANLVAFNNLYVNSSGTGSCPGNTPLVMFAYNVTTATGGKIDTSPVISLDGTEIAFVETVAGNPGSAIFHVLTWQAGQGAIGAAVTPTQMWSLPFSTTPNTTSSPWVDYSSDTAYIGDIKGNVFQITPVFNGKPKLSGSPWPVAPSAPSSVTSPVLDSNLGLLMVGSVNGNIYQIPIGTPGSFTTATVGSGTSPQIVAPPIVDITNGTTFVVASDIGTSAALEQFQTADLTIRPVIGAIGQGASGGTKMHLYQPAFSNAYYNYVNGGTNNGVVSLCGTGPADTTPYQYTFGFVGATLNPASVSPRQLSTGTVDRCTGWTEFYNPNAGPTTNITATSIASNVLTVSTPNTLIVGEDVYIQGTAETYLNGQTVTVTSLVNPGSPNGGFTANFTAGDYTNNSDTGTVAVVDVITATLISGDVLFVAANNANLTVGEQVIIQGTDESFLNNQFVTIASLVGPGPLHSGFTANFTASSYFNSSDTGTVGPGTDFFFFGLTGDCATLLSGSPTGCVVAIANNAGTITTTTAPVFSGTSGIVVDNYSTAAQASSIYLNALGNNTAFKFTQEGLQ